MKIVLSLNQKERMYDYIDMGIDTFVLGGQYSFHAPYCFSYAEIELLTNQYADCYFYVAVNALYDQYVIADLEKYIDQLSKLNIKGILFQDFGVLQIVKEKHYHFDMMYDPETLNTNANTLNVLKEEGVTSAFLSKVIPLEEQLMILKEVHMPLMLHGHGVEYIAASKRTLLSNYKEASLLEFDLYGQTHLKLKAKNSDYLLRIFEDEKGTHIFSDTRLYTLDLFNQIQEFDYLYIETLMMSEGEAIEVASLYSDALKSFKNGTYNKDVKEYMNLLYRLKTPLDRGFLFDQTVYKLEDMRKMDNEKRESNH
ncbi:peptidase U32 family protein [Candidatus Stoquefichus massiliensis]|uniref:peptidase U32 family protein n=1 Tax=Candidatus Stoquefichus massiliensis TaxID=1470350 RepID=UPI000480FA77|nr:U32 family peptidase [Candidatus Stoquefichus massiliensis]